VRVVGVQAEGAASAGESLKRGEVYEIDSVDTIADGIATRSIGEQTLEVMSEYVDEVVTVDDREIALALTLLLERSKTLVEGPARSRSRPSSRRRSSTRTTRRSSPRSVAATSTSTASAP